LYFHTFTTHYITFYIRISNFDERQIFINSQYNGGYKGTFTQNYNEATQQLIEHLENSLQEKNEEIQFLRQQLAVLLQEKN